MTCPLAHPAERGAATILVMLGLLAAVALGMLFANRGLLLETRMAANQARATVAFEAAEAGLEWSVGQLNAPPRSGADCRADAAAATSFRDRVTVATADGLGARPAADGTPIRAACIRRPSGWACHCPNDGAAVLPASDGPDPAGFVVELRAGERAGTLLVVSRSQVGQRAGAQVAATLALQPALASAPGAAVMARGTVGLGSATLANEDPASAGLVVHAGGPVTTASATLTTTAGSSSAGTLAASDARLAAPSGERLFTALFGLPRDVWARQPGVLSLDCRTDCDEAVAAAGRDGPYTMLALDGGARLAGPVQLGTPDRPIALVVRGRLVLDGPLTIHGLVFADGIDWQGAAGGAVHGALVSSADVALTAAVTVRRDAAVLDALMRRTGPLVRVPGSWRDF